ncbi:MAG: hypothetical protein AB7V46_06740 [Thermomicrobiales bacterium]
MVHGPFRVIFIAASIIAFAFAGSGARSATEIVESNPVEGSSLESLPRMVDIWSSEVLPPALTQIIVVAPNGARIDAGLLIVDANDPRHLSAEILSGGPAGRYAVHLLSGEPNTARERSDHILFDVSGETACVEDAEQSSPACIAALPEAAPGEPVHLENGASITVDISQTVAGPVDISVTLVGQTGQPPDQGRVWIRAMHLEMDHGEFPHEAVRTETGAWTASYVGMGMAGDWRIAVDVILDPGAAPLTVVVPVEMESPG